MPLDESFDGFHPVVRRWFERAFGKPTPPQILGWPSISSGSNTLILAPTGSGKTLAAFLWGINHLVEQHLHEELTPGVRILYISPLKALNNDIHRNLEEPLQGIRAEAHASGINIPKIHTAVRTGDTPQSKRAAMIKHPPDVLITTPESLYLMLTSKQARKMFQTVQYVIIDEIHSICGNKRGVHLSLSLERLAAVAEQDFIRIGLSATQRPLDQIAGFLGGQTWENKKLVPRPVNIIDAGYKKQIDLQVKCAAPDFSILPQESVWPLVFVELLEHIRLHRTTLIFVNNRRLAERVAAKLNEMIMGQENTFNLYAVPRTIDRLENEPSSNDQKVQDITTEGILVQAYHGSMSRHAREQMESDLKNGKLRALVATSSLELGIDIGSIDLVIQLQSPKGVARGLQRVGRSGHLITATSKGRIFPTHREDLVESAVVARAMMQHDVEFTNIPKDCLDVLAQQIVAMVSVENWDVDDLFALIRQSYCYNHLSRKLYMGVVQMLAGRYTHEAFRELRARISWDKINNTLSSLPGSGQLAITSGGTISDRGYFAVYLEDRTTKVGEVDEEFVYESRAGDTFILGTNVWRITSLDANKLTVVPAPGEPARMPFWRGEGIGRSFELGKHVGAFRREMSERIKSPDCLTWLRKEFPIDSHSAWNIQEYFRKQMDSSGIVPHDKLLVMEGFRDEVGDPRLVLHSTFGRRVNGLLGLVLSHRLQEATGTEPQMLYNDDGILLRCSDVDELPLNLLTDITTKEAGQLVLDELLSSSLFGGQFRQNAARALLMPKLAPGKRTPLWLQRLRAGDLLQIARRFDDFPIVIETIREVLNDVLDFEHFQEVIRDIEQGVVTVKTVRSEVPSPFAASLLFDFIAVYMYEWDQPKADKMSQFLSINREVLSDIIDLDTISSMLRPDAIDAVVNQLQRTTDGYKARSPEELLEILLRVGDLSENEIINRCVDNTLAMLDELRKNGRTVLWKFPTGPRWIAGEEEAIYNQLNADGHAGWVIRRYLQNHGPTAAIELAGRYDMTSERVNSILENISSQGEIIQGRFQTGADRDEQQWCYRPNLERIHRQTISVLRKEIKASSLAEYTHFLFHWQEQYPALQESGTTGLDTALLQLQGLPLPLEIWERDIFARRMQSYSTDLLLRMTGNGSVICVGSGTGKTKFILRGEGNSFLPPLTQEREEALHESGRRVLAYLRGHGASFLSDIRAGTKLSLSALNNGIAELFWNGILTNDVYTELQAVKRNPREDPEAPLERVEMIDPKHNPRKTKLMQTVRRALKQVPGWSGRWSLVHQPSVLGDSLSLEQQAARQAVQFLARYGIVAREFYRREEFLPWSLVATELQRMELKGEIRRGYFIEGLSGMQYALPSAVEELRRVRTEPLSETPPIIVNACDPANPYGTGIDLPNAMTQTLRITRIPGNYLVFQRGVPVLFLENHGTRIWTLAETGGAVIHTVLRSFAEMIKLPVHMRPFKEIVIEQCDGVRTTQSPLEPILRSVGFYRDKNQSMRFDGYA